MMKEKDIKEINKYIDACYGYYKNKDEKDKETTKKLSMDIPIEKQNLQEETWNLIAMIYLKYLCEDEKEKKELEQIYDENEKKYREEMKEK